MEIVLYILIGVAVGAVATYLLMNRRLTALRIEHQSLASTLKLKEDMLAEKAAIVLRQ